MSDKIFVIDETVEYPDGANSIEINGTGDERLIPRFPELILNISPREVISNGTDVVTCTATIYDYNTTTPFVGTSVVDEVANSNDTRFDFSTSENIRLDSNFVPILSAWEDANHTYPIDPMYFMAIEGSKVHLRSDFLSAYTGNPGLTYQQVYVNYETGPTLAISAGSQPENWWEKNADGTTRIIDPKTLGSVGGTFFYDLACTRPILDNAYIIPVSALQSTNIVFYYKPNSGDYGNAYINIGYSGLTVTSILSVIPGSATAELSAEPTTVAVGEKSIITLKLSNNSIPLNYVDVSFFIFSGGGSISGAQTITRPLLNIVEQVQSSSSIALSVENNIVRVVSIVSQGWVWDSTTTTFFGNSIQLGSSNQLPIQNTIATVTYDTGGVCSCVYTAPATIPAPVVQGTEPEQLSTIVARFLSTDASIFLTVNLTGGSSSLSIEANPSSINTLQTSEITVYSTYVGDDGVTTNKGKSVAFGLNPAGCGVLSLSSVLLGEATAIVELGVSADGATLSPSKLINTSNHAATAWFINEGRFITVASVTLTSIILSETPAAGSTFDIQYNAIAVAKITYSPTGYYRVPTSPLDPEAVEQTAANGTDVEVNDVIVAVFAVLDGIDGSSTADCTLNVGNPDDSDIELTIDATENTIYTSKVSNSAGGSSGTGLITSRDYGWRKETGTEGETDTPESTDITVQLLINNFPAASGTPYLVTIYGAYDENNSTLTVVDYSSGAKVETVKYGAMISSFERAIQDTGPNGENYTGQGKDTFKLTASDYTIQDIIVKVQYLSVSSDLVIKVDNLAAAQGDWLTYDIPVQTIVGWARPMTADYGGSSEFISNSNALFKSFGSRDASDEWGGINIIPTGVDATDIGPLILIYYKKPSWLWSEDLVSISVSGARLVKSITIPVTTATTLNPYPDLMIFGVQWNFDLNKMEHVITITDKGSKNQDGAISEGAPISGARVWVASGAVEHNGLLTNKEGQVTFRNLPPGEHGVFVYSKNHYANMSDAVWAATYGGGGLGLNVTYVGEADDDGMNDVTTVPPGTARPYIIKETDFTIEVTATVRQSSRYDALISDSQLVL